MEIVSIDAKAEHCFINLRLRRDEATID